MTGWRQSPALYIATGLLALMLLGYGIANLTGIGYRPGDDDWRTFVGVFSIVNAQFLIAGLILGAFRSRLGTMLLVIAAMIAFMTFAPIPIVFQVHALIVFALAIRRARQSIHRQRVVA